MKTSYLLNYAILAFGAVFMISCNKDDDQNPKTSEKKISAYVSQQTGSAARDSVVFTYNTDGSLKRTENFEITATTKTMNYLSEFEYVNNRLVSVTYSEMIGNTKNFEDKDSISYDSNNRPYRIIDMNYSNGKMVLGKYHTKITYNTDNFPQKYEYEEFDSQTNNYSVYSSQTFEYTDKNIVKTISLDRTSNFTHDTKKNPFKDNPQFMGDYIFYNTNNQLTSTWPGLSRTFTYEYNSDDYPTKITTVSTSDNGTSTVTLKLYYK